MTIKLILIYHYGGYSSKSHVSLNIFNITNKQNQSELPYLYWTPKLLINPYKQRYIVGSSQCPTNLFSYINSSKGETSKVICKRILKRRCKLDVDTYEFQVTFRKPETPKINQNQLHQIVGLF